MKDLIVSLLDKVQKPAQYLGLEHGAACKDWGRALSRMVLIYPDLYELGMSNFGTKILYSIVNSHPDYLCDRAFAPMADMESLLRADSIPLWALESYRAIRDFDFIGFSLSYELCYTNLLNILDLAQIPLDSASRELSHPLVFGGGPAVFNPEPMAKFMDFYLVGDGEDLIIEIQDCLVASRKRNSSRAELLLALAQIPGVYVPSLYTVSPVDNYVPKPLNKQVPERVRKRIAELSDLNQPSKIPIAHISTVQDKQSLEIRRGCDRGCRFCQVGYAYLPVRERSPQDLKRLSSAALKHSGYDAYSLLSLSASDYTCLKDLSAELSETHSPQGISMSLPSQRADRFDLGIALNAQEVRKSGMTFAPEAGSERLRRVINKGLSDEDICRAIKGSYQAGWSHIKLYYMIGLPTETFQDLDGILDTLSWSMNMAEEVRREERRKQKLMKDLGETYTSPKLKALNITCTISTFVPKSFTAFQYYPQCSQEDFRAKISYLRDGLRARGLRSKVKLNCTQPDIALLEAVLSRGDRRWGSVIEQVWRAGSRMDSWSEHFDITRWREAAQACGLDLELEASREGRLDEPQQVWEVLDLGFTESFFRKEWEAALAEAQTDPCTESKCHACGVCFRLDSHNIVTVNRSDNNPFVRELDSIFSDADFAKRKSLCAGTSQAPDLSTNHQEAQQQDLNTNHQSPDLKTNHQGQKLRCVISKTGDLRFLGHLDFQKLVERAFRRTGLAFVHTEGFNQRLKISWGGALGLFIESEWEYIELELIENLSNLENLREILNQELPEGAKIKSVEVVKDKSSINKVLELGYKARLISPLDLKLDLKDCLKDPNLNMQILSATEIFLKVPANTKIASVLAEIYPEAKWRVCKTMQVLEPSVQALV